MNVGAIFVDGANMSRCLTARSHRGKGKFLLDYAKLTKALEGIFLMPFRYKTYYTAHQDEAGLERRKEFYKVLERDGWTVFDHQARRIVNRDHPDGVWVDKGVDLAIGLDAYRLALERRVRTIVLATHDTDFIELFNRFPPDVQGAIVGWREWIRENVWPKSVDQVHLDGLGVLR